MKYTDFFPFITELYALKKWQLHQFVTNSFPQTLYLNSESFVAVVENIEWVSSNYLSSERKFQFVLTWHLLFPRPSMYFNMQRKQLKELHHLWWKYNQNYHYIHDLFTFYCLCLYLFHWKWCAVGKYCPVYTEYNFPFPSININAAEWWEGSMLWGRDTEGFKWRKDKWKNSGRARCCLWREGQQLHASRQEQ